MGAQLSGLLREAQTEFAAEESLCLCAHSTPASNTNEYRQQSMTTTRKLPQFALDSLVSSSLGGLHRIEAKDIHLLSDRISR